MGFLKHGFFILLLGLATGLCQAAISEQQYNSILDLIQRTYQPEYLARDWRLQVTKYWESDSLSATAWKHEDSEGEVSVIQINGGIARHPEINEDGFALIVCHAIGHHLAGPPRIWKFSVEGQADYFGASACLRKVLPIMGAAPNPDQAGFSEAKAHCSQSMDGADEQQLCTRIILAGLSAAHYHAAKESQSTPTLDTPDQSMAKGILREGQSAQCRLDTYMAAALCDHDANSGTSEAWLCSTRPKCWYNP